MVHKTKETASVLSTENNQPNFFQVSHLQQNHTEYEREEGGHKRRSGFYPQRDCDLLTHIHPEEPDAGCLADGARQRTRIGLLGVKGSLLHWDEYRSSGMSGTWIGGRGVAECSWPWGSHGQRLRFIQE